MSTRYQVNGHTPGWIYAARIFAILAAGGAAFLLGGKDRDLGIFFLICIALPVVAMEIYAAIIRGRRAWIDVLPAGLKLIDRHGEREIQDYEFVSLSYANERLLSNGHPAGCLRKCRLWTAQGNVIELRNKLKEGHADPLAEFIERVGSLLKEGFEQALAEGVEVSGDGWTLTKSALRYQVGRCWEEAAIANITAIHDTEGKLGVWVHGQETPTAYLRLDGRNAWLLSELVAPYQRATPDGDEPPVEGLGRVIFKRRADRILMVITMLVAGAVLTAGCIGLTSNDLNLLALGGIALGVLLGVAAANLAVADFRCQEWGVMQRNLLGKRQLLYRDIESFTYGATRTFVNGAYTGTSLQLVFVPLAGRGRTIAHYSNVQGDDHELDRLRDVVSHIMAAQMHTRLAEGEQVAWTDNLAFTQDGLIYSAPGLLVRGKATLLPFSEYQGYDLRDGYFYLFEKGNTHSVMSEKVAAANFFPGFYLLLQIAHSQVAGNTGKTAAPEAK